MSVPESRSYRFPKSRSKNLPKAVKIAKALPGFEKQKNYYQVSFGSTEAGSEQLWELLKISSNWKGATFLIDGEEVDQKEWEATFLEAGVPEEDSVAVEEPVVGTAPPEEVVSKPSEDDAPIEEPEPEPIPEPEQTTVEAEESVEEKPVVEEDPEAEEAITEVVEESAEVQPEPAVEELDEPEPEEDKKAEEPPEKEETPATEPAKAPPKVIINAPPPQENSGCGKQAAVLMLAAIGLLSLFR